MLCFRPPNQLILPTPTANFGVQPIRNSAVANSRANPVQLGLHFDLALQQFFYLAARMDDRRVIAPRKILTDPLQAQRVEPLLARIRDWQQKLGDTAPLSVANPQPREWTPPADGTP